MAQPLVNWSSKTLADFSSPALMLPQLRSRTSAAVIAELSGILQREGLLPDDDAFCSAVLRREQMSSTAMPSGWALPHARLAGLPQLCFVLARAPQPLVWSAEARSLVHTVFLFAAPEAEAKAYLNLISAVARLSQSPDLAEQLRRASDAPAMFAVLQHVPVNQVRPQAANLASSIH